jgi:hypothetical protein
MAIAAMRIADKKVWAQRSYRTEMRRTGFRFCGAVDREDRRRRVLNLTPAGRQMLKSVTPGSRRARQHLLRLFTATEQAFLMQTLNGIIASFEASAG